MKNINIYLFSLHYVTNQCRLTNAELVNRLFLIYFRLN